MSDRQRKLYTTELRQLIARSIDEGLVPEAIRLIPRVQELLSYLYNADDLVAKAQRDIIRRFIAEILNEDGTRTYVYLEQLELYKWEPQTLDEGQADLAIHPVYARATDIVDSPWRQQEALRTGRKRLLGNLTKMYYLRDKPRLDAINYLGMMFDQEIAALSQQKLPMPATDERAVNLNDVTKTTLDKLGDEAGTQPWNTAEGNRQEDVG